MGDMKSIILNIPHDPVSWTAPRLARGFCYSPHSKYTKIFQRIISALYRDKPITSYVHVDCTFYFPMPKSATKKRRDLMEAGKIYPTKSDCTNLQKFCEDCLKRIVIVDDRNVVQISSKKLYAALGSVKIVVTPCE